MEGMADHRPTVWRRAMKFMQTKRRHHQESGALYTLDQWCRGVSTLTLVLAVGLAVVALQCDLLPRVLFPARRDVTNPDSRDVTAPCVTHHGPCPVRADVTIDSRMKTSGRVVATTMYAGVTVVVGAFALSLTLIANWPGLFQFQRPYTIAASLQATTALLTLGAMVTYHVTGVAVDDVIVVCWLGSAMSAYLSCVLFLFPSMTMAGLDFFERKKPSSIAVFVIDV